MLSESPRKDQRKADHQALNVSWPITPPQLTKWSFCAGMTCPQWQRREAIIPAAAISRKTSKQQDRNRHIDLCQKPKSNERSKTWAARSSVCRGNSALPSFYVMPHG
jgi:hypothetical protein